MILFTEEEILLGAGRFEQAMREQSDIPDRYEQLSSGEAIGVLSAAMRSRLPSKLIVQTIDQHFGDSAVLLKRILDRYEGNDWSVDLWNRLPSGQHKLCTELCRPGLPRWRYDPSAREADG